MITDLRIFESEAGLWNCLCCINGKIEWVAERVSYDQAREIMERLDTDCLLDAIEDLSKKVRERHLTPDQFERYRDIYYQTYGNFVVYPELDS